MAYNKIHQVENLAKTGAGVPSELTMTDPKYQNQKLKNKR